MQSRSSTPLLLALHAPFLALVYGLAAALGVAMRAAVPAAGASSFALVQCQQGQDGDGGTAGPPESFWPGRVVAVFITSR
jgi:hypothetical protein